MAPLPAGLNPGVPAMRGSRPVPGHPYVTTTMMTPVATDPNGVTVGAVTAILVTGWRWGEANDSFVVPSPVVIVARATSHGISFGIEADVNRWRRERRNRTAAQSGE